MQHHLVQREMLSNTLARSRASASGLGVVRGDIRLGKTSQAMESSPTHHR